MYTSVVSSTPRASLHARGPSPRLVGTFSSISVITPDNAVAEAFFATLKTEIVPRSGGPAPRPARTSWPTCVTTTTQGCTPPSARTPQPKPESTSTIRSLLPKTPCPPHRSNSRIKRRRKSRIDVRAREQLPGSVGSWSGPSTSAARIVVTSVGGRVRVLILRHSRGSARDWRPHRKNSPSSHTTASSNTGFPPRETCRYSRSRRPRPTSSGCWLSVPSSSSTSSAWSSNASAAQLAAVVTTPPCMSAKLAEDILAALDAQTVTSWSETG